MKSQSNCHQYILYIDDGTAESIVVPAGLTVIYTHIRPNVSFAPCLNSNAPSLQLCTLHLFQHIASNIVLPHHNATYQRNFFRNPDCLIILLTIWLNVASNHIPAGISKTLREKICVVRKVFILCFRGKTVNIITMTA